MKLPNADKVIISKKKITEYILSETHPRGKNKARVFKKFGFNRTNYLEFKTSLKKLVIREKVKKVIEISYGVVLVVEGIMETPVGINIKVRSVWIVRKGEVNPRLVTCYPL